MESTDAQPVRRTVSVKIIPGPTPGMHTVAFQSQAFPGSLATFAGTLAAQRLAITSAVVRLGDDGMVTDVFDVVPLEGGPFGREHEDRLKDLALAFLSGERDLTGDLEELHRAYPERLSMAPRVEIRLDSAITTGVNVACADRPGLLYDIASTLSRHGMHVRFLAVLTFDRQARDTFRVVDAEGRAPTQPAVIDALRDELLLVCA